MSCVCLCAARDFTPSDGHPVLSLSWSPTGDAFLVVMSSAQPRIYDRWGVLSLQALICHA